MDLKYFYSEWRQNSLVRWVCLRGVRIYLICKLGKHSLLRRTALLLLEAAAFVCVPSVWATAAVVCVCAEQINNISANKGFALMMKHATAALSN